MSITVTKLDTGGFEIIEGIASPRYVSELGYDTINDQIVATNKCGSAESKPHPADQWTIICEGVSSETGFTSNKDLVKSLDALCVGFGKVCASSGPGTPVDVIYGSNLNLLTSSDTFTTQSNTTVESVFDEDTNGVPDGLYEVQVQYFWNGSNIRQDIETFLFINSNPVGSRPNGLIHKQEPKDAAGNWNGTNSLQQMAYTKTFYFTKATGSVDPINLNLNFRTTGNNSRASIWDPSIKIFRIQ